MNKKSKIWFSGIFTLAMLMLVLSAGSASANSRDDHGNSKPRINKDITTTRNSATLSFKARKFRNETVNVIVSVKDSDTGNLVEKAMKATLDGDGNGMVTVKGLKSGTNYDFKVRIMRMGSDRSTQNSEVRSETTM